MGLLRQNLAAESDLQGISGFVLESVAWLKGRRFAATPVLPGLMQKLRAAGAASGYPLPVIFSLNGNQLPVSWGRQTEQVVNLTQLPPRNRPSACSANCPTRPWRLIRTSCCSAIGWSIASSNACCARARCGCTTTSPRCHH